MRGGDLVRNVLILGRRADASRRLSQRVNLSLDELNPLLNVGTSGRGLGCCARVAEDQSVRSETAIVVNLKKVCRRWST